MTERGLPGLESPLFYLARRISATTIPAKMSPQPNSCRGANTSPINRKQHSATKIRALCVEEVNRCATVWTPKASDVANKAG